MVKRIRCRDWIDTEKSIWIISEEYNALLHIEKETKIVRTEIIFEKYPLYKPGWYYSGILFGEYIVCIPAAAKDIAVYSLRNRSMYYIPIANSNRICQEECNSTDKFFSRGYAYGENLLIFGVTYPTLVSVNLKEKRSNYIDDWVRDAERYILRGGDTIFYFGDGYVKFKNNLFIPLTCCGAFLATELDTLQCRIVFLPGKFDSIEGVIKLEDKFCFVGRKEEMYYLCLWHPEDGGMNKLQIPYQGKSFAWISFLRPIFWKTKVYLIPWTADHFYVVDLESEEIDIENNMEVMISEFPTDMQDCKISALKQNGNIVVFQTWWDYKWHRYNLDTGGHEDFELILDDENYTRRYQNALCHKLIDEKTIILEDTISIQVFLDEITNMKQSHSKCIDSFIVDEQEWEILLKTGK